MIFNKINWFHFLLNSTGALSMPNENSGATTFFKNNLFSALSILVAMFFAGLTILLQVFRARAKRELHELFFGLSQQLNMPQQFTLNDLYDKRDLLYGNKRSLEAQMSRKLDSQTAESYRTVIVQNERNIKELEKQLPFIENLRKKKILYNFSTFICAVMIIIIFCLYLAYKDRWN